MTVHDILSIEEIRFQFPSEWVLIGEPQIDELTCLQAGRVVFHSPVRYDVYRKAVELRLPHSAIRYFGTLPENMELVLMTAPFDPTKGAIPIEAEVSGPTGRLSPQLLIDTGATMT